MPITPFHFGPALAGKAAAGARFSFMIFCYSQVVTDLESGFYLLRGEYPVHRFFHTYIGATLVGLFCAVTGRWLAQMALGFWKRWSPELFSQLVGASASISWPVTVLSAFVGTFSHVFFDSIMHRDMHPFSPFHPANAMLGLIDLAFLHLACIGFGVVGLLGYLLRRWFESSVPPHKTDPQ